MEIKKAQWASDGDNVRLTMPLSKVDKENRLVSGWASLDNADSQGDIVLKEANQRAFSRFRGNIREMHQPIAVGRMVDFKEDSYFDQETQKFYNGIFVTVYVSKGAQDTWEKVLDGTLQGFSIGGAIKDAETQWVKDAGKAIRFVKDYELVELSLVDSPANQLANVFSITKAADGSTVMKGMVADTRSENVFYCEADGIAKTSTEDTVSCGNCGSAMQNIGWFEYENDEDKTEKVSNLIANRNSSNTSGSEEPIAKQETAHNEGGVIVAEENKTPETEVDAGSTATVVDEVAEEGKAETEVESSTESVAEKADEEKPEEGSEAVEAEDETDISKMFGDLQTAIESGLEKNAKAADEAIEKATKAFENKVEELVQKHDELVNKFESLKTDIGGVEKRLGVVESETAIKKSGDLGGSTEETLQKSNQGSTWGGRFLGLSDLH
ncbi:capsid maturation protease [Streptomyces phage Comrade]|uniref:Capsid maturation protease n=2 Tax=Gilsonvirus comrade TaxID=2846395 RepID=A0A345MDW1_9CAUD|nr:head maturation protease [Streptomyces phage Comrade]AXH68742.1 capsid maturation protease [Streptomyces phage SparkleGoddess]AXQ63300.1 capsid maturation protease [Streptomyces phage Comrade]UTN92283.1 capsid maturation protease [Streptomyces phage Stigma]